MGNDNGQVAGYFTGQGLVGLWRKISPNFGWTYKNELEVMILTT